MTPSAIVIGIDVAKERLDVAVRPSGETWSEANDDAGVRACGRASVRTALFLAAMCGRRWNPTLKIFYDRLKAAGKPTKIALIALRAEIPDDPQCDGAGSDTLDNGLSIQLLTRRA